MLSRTTKKKLFSLLSLLLLASQVSLSANIAAKAGEAKTEKSGEKIKEPDMQGKFISQIQTQITKKLMTSFLGESDSYLAGLFYPIISLTGKATYRAVEERFPISIKEKFAITPLTHRLHTESNRFVYGVDSSEHKKAYEMKKEALQKFKEKLTKEEEDFLKKNPGFISSVLKRMLSLQLMTDLVVDYSCFGIELVLIAIYKGFYPNSQNRTAIVGNVEANGETEARILNLRAQTAKLEAEIAKLEAETNTIRFDQVDKFSAMQVEEVEENNDDGAGTDF